MTIKETIESYISKVMESDMDESWKEDYLDIAKDVVKDSSDYVKSVNGMEQQLQVARFRMEPDELRVYCQELDSRRRILHNALMGSVSAFKKLLDKFGIEIDFSVEGATRYDYADLAIRVVNEYCSSER